jgi:hypothetical protein
MDHAAESARTGTSRIYLGGVRHTGSPGPTDNGVDDHDSDTRQWPVRPLGSELQVLEPVSGATGPEQWHWRRPGAGGATGT